ncbi:hypothetical protein F4677DRAFT_446725 [Hypoxylon crocopeplum]|nr:hypothetical protein F4677DRAFT_446725 [Hypoxylon crocopeplum]
MSDRKVDSKGKGKARARPTTPEIQDPGPSNQGNPGNPRNLRVTPYDSDSDYDSSPERNKSYFAAKDEEYKPGFHRYIGGDESPEIIYPIPNDELPDPFVDTPPRETSRIPFRGGGQSLRDSTGGQVPVYPFARPRPFILGRNYPSSSQIILPQSREDPSSYPNLFPYFPSPPDSPFVPRPLGERPEVKRSRSGLLDYLLASRPPYLPSPTQRERDLQALYPQLRQPGPSEQLRQPEPYQTQLYQPQRTQQPVYQPQQPRAQLNRPDTPLPHLESWVPYQTQLYRPEPPQQQVYQSQQRQQQVYQPQRPQQPVYEPQGPQQQVYQPQLPRAQLYRPDTPLVHQAQPEPYQTQLEVLQTRLEWLQTQLVTSQTHLETYQIQVETQLATYQTQLETYQIQLLTQLYRLEQLQPHAYQTVEPSQPQSPRPHQYQPEEPESLPSTPQSRQGRVYQPQSTPLQPTRSQLRSKSASF